MINVYTIPETYSVVKKEVSNEKRDRQQSITQLITEWNIVKKV